jgi:hypothetical protein
MAILRKLLSSALLFGVLFSNVCASRNDVLFNKIVKLTGDLSQPFIANDELRILSEKADRPINWLNFVPNITTPGKFSGAEIAHSRKEALNAANDIKSFIGSVFESESTLLETLATELKKADLELQDFQQWEGNNIGYFKRLLENDKQHSKVANTLKNLQQESSKQAGRLAKSLSEGPDLLDSFARGTSFVYSALNRYHTAQQALSWFDWLTSSTIMQDRSIGRQLQAWKPEKWSGNEVDIKRSLKNAAEKIVGIVAPKQVLWWSFEKSDATVTTVVRKIETLKKLRESVGEQFHKLQKLGERIGQAP